MHTYASDNYDNYFHASVQIYLARMYILMHSESSLNMFSAQANLINGLIFKNNNLWIRILCYILDTLSCFPSYLGSVSYMSRMRFEDVLKYIPLQFNLWLMTKN